MSNLDGLTHEQLSQYREELLAMRQELLDAMSEERRVKPTLEIGTNGVPVQKGQSGEVMMDNAQNEKGYRLDDVNKAIKDVERRLNSAALLNSMSSLWLRRPGYKRVEWYD